MSRGILQGVVSAFVGLVTGAALLSIGNMLIAQAFPEILATGRSDLDAVRDAVSAMPPTFFTAQLASHLAALFVGAFIASFLAPKHPRFSRLVRRWPGWVTTLVLASLSVGAGLMTGAPAVFSIFTILGAVLVAFLAQALGDRLSRRGRIGEPAT